MQVRCRCSVFSARWHSAAFRMVEGMLMSVETFVVVHFCFPSWSICDSLMIWFLNQAVILCRSCRENIVLVPVPSPLYVPSTIHGFKRSHAPLYALTKCLCMYLSICNDRERFNMEPKREKMREGILKKRKDCVLTYLPESRRTGRTQSKGAKSRNARPKQQPVTTYNF